MEQVIPPFFSCNLSAINVAKFAHTQEDGEVWYDWKSLYEVAYNVAGLMDNVIDNMEFPDDRFKENTLNYRPIGIGPMGLADAMFKLGYSYDKSNGRIFAEKIMLTLTTAAWERSADIAREKGPLKDYEIFKEDFERIIGEHVENNPVVMDKVKKYGVRNSQVTTAQPTGTTALSCDASYGIEPSFGLVFQKNLITGEKMTIVNKFFNEKYKKESWYSEELLDRIFKNGGSLKGVHGIPKEVREIFVVAHDIKYKDRIDFQAGLQKYCSTSISSTVNLPKEITKEEVSDLFKYAYEKGLKGITIYRDGTKKNQPVTFTNDVKEKEVDFIRPTKLSSNTFKVDTGNGSMYVNVSDFEGKPLEVFLQLGKSGQLLNTFSEALGRMISISLQGGISVEMICETLGDINSDQPYWFRFEPTDKKPTQILSIPDAVAKLLKKYYSGKQYKGELTDVPCPKCGNSLIPIEGCFSCSGCGYSKCS